MRQSEPINTDINFDISSSGMGSDIIIAMDGEGVIVDVSCRIPEVMLNDRSQLIGEHISTFLNEDMAALQERLRHSRNRGGIVQANFKYETQIKGVKQEFTCELVGTGDSHPAGYRWLALINLIEDSTFDNWRFRAKNRLLFAVTQASEVLMSDRDFVAAMNDALYYIGNGIGVDRVYFFAAESCDSGEKIYLSQKFEWCSEFVEPQIDNPELQKADMSLFPDMWSQLINDRHFKAIVSDMPDNITHEVLAAQSIKSVLVIPIFIGGDFWGMLGFDDCQYERRWKGVYIAILKMFAAIISARATKDGADEIQQQMNAAQVD